MLKMGHEKDQENEKGIVMDTPERTHIATPLSKFEDSPVFNYINSLSPIKPVKSMHFTQSLNTLSFASIPSVFTSPHASSIKDSKYLKRHQFSDQSKPELTSEDAKKLETSEGILNATQNRSKQHSDFNSVVTSNSCPNLESKNLSYETVRFINSGSENGQFRIETEIEGINQIPQSKEVTECDWDSLISDDSELLNFNSPGDTGPGQSMLHHAGFNTSLMNIKPQTNDDNLSEDDEGFENNVTVVSTSLNNFEVGEKLQDADNEVGSNLYRGMRRRCLLFESTRSRIHLQDVTNASVANGNDSSKCILPGIGLHLNTIASNLVDHKVVMGSGQELMTSLSDPKSFENNIRPVLNVANDASKPLGVVANDELNQSQTSPKKKRRKEEIAVETEACKRCNCKKSKCLKLYCECFAAGVYCVEPCSCLECFNKPIHEETVLATRKQIESRNPLAFAPKVIKTSDHTQEDESSNTPASARHKRGCNCKKSGCLKKYCECYQGGVGCSINCRCEGCKNTFGRKDGSEMNLEVDECDEIGSDGSLLHIETDSVSAAPATPCFGSVRQSISVLNSKGRPPRSFVAIGSSANQRFGKMNPFDSKLQLQTVLENEIPDILEESNGSQMSGNGVNSCSPNSKRVSPPHMGQRTTRKLILQSIPSFPCLTSNPNQ